ncbi:MAG: sigma-70 family RNA polymerase sigma factor [Acidimicrobiales bacterium]
MTDLAAKDRSAGPPGSDVEQVLDHHRTELRGYCYRMLGGAFDAEDAVQDVMVRAWRSWDRFEERSSRRTWLYRIAHNVCIDHLQGRQRRARPMDFGPASRADTLLAEPRPETTWVEPIPDDQVLAGNDPAERAAAQETIRLAFVAALQQLPPRQRGVLILRDVLRWQASEVAALLDTTVASVNSALQRARATLAADDLDRAAPRGTTDEATEALLARYVDAFERYDIDAFVALLHADATQNMPPFDHWLQGAEEMGRWMLGAGAGCRGSRLVPLRANGRFAFGSYRPSGPGGRHEPFSIQVLEIADGRVAAISYFLDTNLFAVFGLPQHPDGDRS